MQIIRNIYFASSAFKSWLQIALHAIDANVVALLFVKVVSYIWLEKYRERYGVWVLLSLMMTQSRQIQS